MDSIIKTLNEWDGDNISEIRYFVEEFIEEFENMDEDEQCKIDKDVVTASLQRGPMPDDLANDFELLAVDNFGRYLVLENNRVFDGDFGFLTKRRLELMNDKDVKFWFKDFFADEEENKQRERTGEAEDYAKLYNLREKNAIIEEIRKVAAELIEKNQNGAIPFYAAMRG